MEIKFDTRVLEIKHKILTKVAKLAYENRLIEGYRFIPEEILPGPTATMRCCNHKEQAILHERVKLACGGDSRNPNIMEVIKIACDECPLGGYTVTNICRGCIAHYCEAACPRHCIYIDPITHTAKIDKTKCINCGLCAKACPYSAIVNYLRPCESACQVKAITIDQYGACEIDNDKCIQCGHCSVKCPFGAIMDKSFMLDAIDILQNKDKKNYNVYAIIAPAIAGQFKGISYEQVVTGLKELGFTYVVEAALGADLVALSEGQELIEKGLLTSSCCPAFVSLINKHYPEVKEHVSHNLSPQSTIAKHLKTKDPTAKMIFIGPCMAKKAEIQREEESKWTDVAITFEELLAMFVAKDIDLAALNGTPKTDASYYGRIFGRSGGLTEAAAEAIRELGAEGFEFKPLVCDGVFNCKQALNKLKRSQNDFNFLEGMACEGGCVGGPAILVRGVRNKMEVDKFAKTTERATIKEAIEALNNHE
jgi:[FeFe] hydrogenase (group B1/B3)